MSEGMASTGIGIRHGMEHRDGEGNLIFAEWTRPNKMSNQYDEWRSIWCNKNRTTKTLQGFREGDITLETLEFALKQGFRPEWSKEQIVKILNSEV